MQKLDLAKLQAAFDGSEDAKKENER
jgi:hypothetical protein